jgi:hypothetical protein
MSGMWLVYNIDSSVTPLLDYRIVEREKKEVIEQGTIEEVRKRQQLSVQEK